MKKDYKKESIASHKKYTGKIETTSKMPLTNTNELSLAYTPGVAGPCLEILKNKDQARKLTSSKNTVAVITDGSSVLGLGNIGPEAALPVMEGKAILFKKFGDIDAFPIVLGTTDVDEIVETIARIAPTFGGINLEDISAPRCFEIEEQLKERLPIPVFHDDQHGTAIVVLAGLINALNILDKKRNSIKVFVNGAGAAGTAIVKLLSYYGIKNITIADSHGVISQDRTDLSKHKKELLNITNKENLSGKLEDGIVDAGIFIGVSKGNILNEGHIKSMAKDPVVFALANPTPEIMPDMAKKSGAAIVATGGSDFSNQINNVLVFPGIFKGAFMARGCKITDEVKVFAAHALAKLVKNPDEDNIIPDPFTKGVADAISEVVACSYNKTCASSYLKKIHKGV